MDIKFQTVVGHKLKRHPNKIKLSCVCVSTYLKDVFLIIGMLFLIKDTWSHIKIREKKIDNVNQYEFLNYIIKKLIRTTDFEFFSSFKLW